MYSRRQFLEAAGAVGLAGSLGAIKAEGAEAHAVVASKDAMGVLVDLTKCNGCRRCEAACCEANGFPVPSEESLSDKSVFAARRTLGPRQYTTINEHRVPGNGDERPVYVKTNCMHCVDPACASACLVGALRKQLKGAVTYDAQKCMGCRYCMVACPFDVPTYEYDNAFTPQVRKCTFCFGKTALGESQVPACVRACPKECLTSGPRAELLARAHSKIAQHPDMYIDHVYGEHEAGGTSWLYLSHAPFEKVGLRAFSADAPPRLSESIQHGVFAYFMPPIAWCAALGLTMWLTAHGREWRSEQAAESQGASAHTP